MATRADRFEARLTTDQREQIEQGAALAGESVSSFVVVAALERAELLVTQRASTVVPATYFDELITALDSPDEAPRLARVARNARRGKRITAG
ncbi:MAG: DUF1778 domain-containing protein [Solirubrobacteraceae bacterium]